MKLKTVTVADKTYAEISDGKPLYVEDDGSKEIAFDYPGTLATIGRLNGEAKAHRTAKEAAETKLAAFDGIEDPEAARKALGVVKNLDSKKLVDAGQIETVKAEAIKAVEEKYAPVVAERDKLKGDLYNEKIGGAFTRSKIIADKFAIPADLVQSRFGQNFKIEDGKTVAYDAAGNKIFSRAKPGELADFDEGLEIIVDAYPYKDQILKGVNANGSGSRGTNTNGSGGKKTISRADFEKLDPMAQRNAAIGKDAMTIIDPA